MDEKLERVATAYKNLKIAEYALGHTRDPELLEDVVADYVRAKGEHDKACRAAANLIVQREKAEKETADA